MRTRLTHKPPPAPSSSQSSTLKTTSVSAMIPLPSCTRTITASRARSGVTSRYIARRSLSSLTSIIVLICVLSSICVTWALCPGDNTPCQAIPICPSPCEANGGDCAGTSSCQSCSTDASPASKCATCLSGAVRTTTGCHKCSPVGCYGRGTCIAAGASAVCQCTAQYTGQTCSDCATGYYNYPTCKACTRAICNNRGTCDSSGNCISDKDINFNIMYQSDMLNCATNMVCTGPGGSMTFCSNLNYQCSYCTQAVTCNNRGSCIAGATCACGTGYTGANCLQCNTGYSCVGAACVTATQSPVGTTCQPCVAATSCSSHGICSAGQCQCETKYGGYSCNQCATNYYNYPSCTYCVASTNCTGHGSCSITTGSCLCNPGWGGASCNQCLPNYYGPACQYCNATTTCNGNGRCDPLSGTCLCNSPNYYNPTGLPTCASCVTGWFAPKTNCTVACGTGNCPSGKGYCAPESGTCTCLAGYQGALCSQCATDYYPFSGTCRLCVAATNCSSHGSCNANGDCVCQYQYANAADLRSQCNACSASRYNYPTCTFCDLAVNCSSHGTCSTRGGCACSGFFRSVNSTSTSQCNECMVGYFGNECDACPTTVSGVACSGHGRCSDGINGNGDCTCDTGWKGSHCGFSDALTCSGHGQVDGATGRCTCTSNSVNSFRPGNLDPDKAEDGTVLAGATQCNLCTPSYYGVNCTFCNSATCASGRGTCDLTGARVCNCTQVNYGGDTCAGCAPNYFGSLCTFCNAASSCSNVGQCVAGGSGGACSCPSNYIGANCQLCQTGFWGTSCLPCPIGSNGQVCSGVGTCFGGKAGNGTCNCNPGYGGPTCYSPYLTSVTPSTTPTAGGAQWHLQGRLFTSTCRVLVTGLTREAVECKVFAQFDTDIICITQAQLPSLLGNAVVYVIDIANNLTSNALPIKYAAPVVYTMSPSNGPADGSTLITITGLNFGSTANLLGTIPSVSDRIYINWICGATEMQVFNVIAATDTTIVFRPPSWAGTCIVEAVISGLPAQHVAPPPVNTLLSPLQYRYDIPSIVTVTGSRATSGAQLITIWGDSFVLRSRGTGDENSDDDRYPGTLTVTMMPLDMSVMSLTYCTKATFFCSGERNCPSQIPSFVDPTFVNGWPAPQGIICYTQNGSVVSMINVTNNGEPSIASYRFIYDVPVVYRVDGCATQVGNMTTGCETSGATLLTITGNNFGMTPSLLSVTVAGFACNGVILITSHTKLSCTITQGYGAASPVIVTQTSGTITLNSAPAYLVSFKSPLIYTVRCVDASQAITDYNGASAGYNSRLLPQVANQYFNPIGIDVQIIGQNFGSVASLIRVTYGYNYKHLPIIIDPLTPIYDCSNVRAVSAGSLTCTLVSDATAIGQFLAFVVTVAGVPSDASADTVTYGPPQFFPATMRFPGISAQGATSVLSNTTQGDIISFAGYLVGNRSDLIHITYGINNQYTCITLSVDRSSGSNACGSVAACSTLTCRTLPGLGSWNMRVTVGSTVHAQIGNTTDQYSYALSPVIWRVSGCTDVGNTTINCPTNGLTSSLVPISLTIYGDYFYGGITKVTIGAGLSCAIQGLQTQNSVRCTLPSGAGLLQSVAVDRGLSFSQSQPLLSYAVPILDTIIGCDQASGVFTITGCIRSGAQMVTIAGQQFGFAGATVLIGGTECLNVIHRTGSEHTSVTCTLPPGTGSNNAVLLFQQGGELSSNSLSLSYQPCAVGTYRASTFSIECSACMPGTFSELVAQVECSDCAAGKYANTSGSTECIDCAAGSFSTGGASTCTPCDANFYSAIPGATACLPCGSGKEAPGSGNSQCRSCSPGSSQSSSISTGPCLLCDAGRAVSSFGATSCAACTIGTSAGAGAVSCAICGAGKYSDALRTSCASCTIGKYSPTAGYDSTCVTCPLGRTSMVEGQSYCDACTAGSYRDASLPTCLPCPPGNYSAADAASLCSRCPEGTAMSDYGASVCSSCGVGTYAPDEYSHQSCLSCSPGYFQAVQGRAQCDPCASGSYTSDPAQSQCIKCPTGKYAKDPALSVCNDCDAGYVSTAAGVTVCSQCAGGQTSSGGTSICYSCVAGTYSSSATLGKCQACDDGTNSGVGSASCNTCIAGRYSSSSRSTCIECSPGTFTASAKSSSCQPCAIGSAQATQGQGNCDDCAAGFKANVTGLATCYPCEPGKFTFSNKNYTYDSDGNPSSPGTGGAVECELCKRGTFSASYGTPEKCQSCGKGSAAPLRGLTACIECARGSWMNVVAQADCFAASIGYFTSVTGAVTQTICGAGTHANVTGLSSCYACPIGQSQYSSGTSFCSACDPGSYSGTEGQAQCAACPVGKSASLAGSSSCDQCAPGTAQDQIASSSCNICYKGTFSAISGSLTCSVCTDGSYSESDQSSSCTPCVRGTFGYGSSLTSCTNCTSGSYAPNPGAATCLVCDPGSISAEMSASCTICTAGTYQSKKGASYCIDCGYGSASLAGSSLCAPCGNGSYANATQASTCSRCVQGRYQSAVGQSDCLDCGIGTYAADVQLIACRQADKGFFVNQTAQQSQLSCQPGTFTDQRGMSSCLECDTGRYARDPGSSICTSCQPGSYSDVYGSSSCQSCIRGSYRSAAGGSRCDLCLQGSFNPLDGQANCTSCSPGRYTDQLGVSTNCTYCNDGEYADRAASGFCLFCPRGKYSSSGASTCTECLPGRYSATTKSTGCHDCDAGEFQTSFGSSECSQCTPGTSASKGAAICNDCAAGFAAPLSSMSQCIPCPSFSVASDSRDTCNCYSSYYDDTTKRPTNMTDDQYRMWMITRQEIGIYCYACPDGVDCSTQGTRFDSLRVEAGWWRVSPQSKSYYSCMVETFCLGGINATCRGNRAGALCQLCKEGYSETADRNCGLCTPDSSRSVGYFTSIAIVFIIGATLVLVMHARADRHLLEELARYMYHRDEAKRRKWIVKWTRQPNLIPSSPTNNDGNDGAVTVPNSPTGAAAEDDDIPPPPEGDDFFDGAGAYEEPPIPIEDDDNNDDDSESPPPPPPTDPDAIPPPPESDGDATTAVVSTDTTVATSSSPNNDTAPSMIRNTSLRSQQYARGNQRRAQQAKKVASVHTGAVSTGPAMTHQFKILLAFFQIATTLAFTLQLPWPTAYRVFLSAFEWLNLDLVTVSGAGCVTKVDFYTSWLAMMLLPFIIAALLTIICVIAAYIYVPYTFAAGAQVRDQRERWFHIWAKLLLFALFLLYPRLSAACLRLFVCTNVEHVDYLVADFSVNCFDTRWTSYLAADVFAILAYPLGIPIGFMYLLYRTHKADKFRDPRVRYTLGFIYRGYKSECWWFEMADMLHKLIMTSIMGVMPRTAQLPIAMVVVVAYFVFILFKQPYSYKADERLHLLAQVQLFMLLVSAQVFSQGGYLDTPSDVAISIFLLIATSYFMLLFIQAVAMKLAGIIGGITCCASCIQRIIDPCSTKRAKKNGAPSVASLRTPHGQHVAKSGAGGVIVTTPSQFVRSASGRTVLMTNARRKPIPQPTDDANDQ